MKIDLNKILLVKWIGGMGRKETIMLDIINWGTKVGEDSINMFTKDGYVTKLKSDVNDGYVKLVNIEDINVKESLYWWFKSHQGEHNKVLVFDENLEAGERYFGNCWRMGLLLSSTENELKYNFIFPE